MSRIFKNKPSWRSMEVPVDEPEQLTLGPPTSAPSARAELKDSAGRQGASGAELRAWPAIGEKVFVRHQMYWTLSGELLEVEEALLHGIGCLKPWMADVECNCLEGWPLKTKRGRVRLDPEQSGLSASLAASLPAILSDVALSQLRSKR